MNKHDEITNNNKTVRMAVDAIICGKLKKNGTLTFPDGKAIRKTSPNPATRWSLFCQENGLDFLTHQEELTGSTVLSVGKPNTHWLERDYYLILSKRNIRNGKIKISA